MKKIEEETCYSCKNKSNIREVLFQLQVVCEDLKTVMNRLVQIEHVQRLSFTTMNGIARTQKRNFDKMMGGFKAIQKGFHMACGAAVQAQDVLSEHLGVLDLN